MRGIKLSSDRWCYRLDVTWPSPVGANIEMLLRRPCNLTTLIHSSTGLVVYLFASRHKGPGFNPHKWIFILLTLGAILQTQPTCSESPIAHSAKSIKKVKTHDCLQEVSSSEGGSPLLLPRYSHTIGARATEKTLSHNWRMRNRENAPQTLLSRAISFLEHNARGRDLVKGGLASNYTIQDLAKTMTLRN